MSHIDHKIFFSKYSGAGNDFILIDDRKEKFPSSNQTLIAQLCHRQQGIGADGLILLQNSSIAHFRMRIFNANGKEAEMCGNGIRCLSKFAQKLGIEKKHFQIETMKDCIQATPQANNILISMPSPREIKKIDFFHKKNSPIQLYLLDTGVPHAITFVNDLKLIDVPFEGASIRNHSSFLPLGVNVNFVEMQKSKNQIWIRTYERGVENETLACGTGATAAALVAAKVCQLESPISVHVYSKAVLKIGFQYNGHSFQKVTMTGPATLTFEGSIF